MADQRVTDPLPDIAPDDMARRMLRALFVIPYDVRYEVLQRLEVEALCYRRAVRDSAVGYPAVPSDD